MTAGEERPGRMEREAIYQMRELFAEGREAVLEEAGEEDAAYVQALAGLALHPEKPFLSFEKEKEGDAAEAAWNPERPNMDFFRLARRFALHEPARRLIACGGVDDGKSTLIGRILFDTMSGQEQERIRNDAAYLRKDKTVDYALLAGTSAQEAQQGITVQVSCSAFTYGTVRFLIADVPGHEEYTRNMAYAASGADTAIVMIGANKGIVPQTRRHVRICFFMGIRTMIFAVNKMDAIAYDQTVYRKLCREIERLMEEFEGCRYKIVPAAAKSGENIAAPSEKMRWHSEGTLLAALSYEEGQERKEAAMFCMPVQRTCKSSQMAGAIVKKRVIQGEAASGSVCVGDEVFVYPTMERAKVSALWQQGKNVPAVRAPLPAGVELDRELDVARGYILTQGDTLAVTDRMDADLLWTSGNRLTQGKRYLAQIGTARALAIVTKILYRTDVNTGEHRYTEYLTKNMLARCEIRFPKPVAAVCEKESRALGAIRLLDRRTHALVAYGNIVHTVSEEAWKENGREVTAEEREFSLGQKAGLILFGEKEAADGQMNFVERYLLGMGFHTIQAAPGRLDEEKKQTLQSFLRAGLIVLAALQKEERLLAAGLLEEDWRVFDCETRIEPSEDRGSRLKKIKLWAAELI